MKEQTNILIVDDDVGICETLSDILVEEGFKVSVVNDGFEAIKEVNKSDYKIALIDIKMPKINGVETYKKIKHIKPSLRVIMMTAFSDEDLGKEALKEGVYTIFYKPLNINELIKFIKKIETETLLLIVDDDPDFCETLKDGLEEANYKVAVNYDGKQTIKNFEENDIDIIFFDVKMPSINGLDLYLTLRKRNPNFTGVMITGYFYEEEVLKMIDEAFKNGLYACLYKPLKRGNLIALIEEICRNKITEKKIFAI